MLPITVNIKNGPSLELTDENLAGFYTPPIEKETNLLAEFLFPGLVRQRFLEAAARQPVTVILRDPETGTLRHVEIIEPLGQLTRLIVEANRHEDLLRGHASRESRKPTGPLFAYPVRGPARYL